MHDKIQALIDNSAIVFGVAAIVSPFIWAARILMHLDKAERHSNMEMKLWTKYGNGEGLQGFLKTSD